MFDAIYGHKNRASGEASVWSRVLEEIGEVTREARYQDRDQLRHQLPDVLAWLCGFCAVAGISLADVVWNRYHAGCPHCHVAACACPPGRPSRVQLENTSPVKTRRQKGAPSKAAVLLQPASDWTIGDWETHLQGVFGARNSTLHIIDVAARITEQAGDVAKAIRQRHVREELEKRVADVFAWTVALWNLARAHGIDAQSSFADLVFDKYTNWCARCRERPCACPSPVARVFISSVMRDGETALERVAVRDVLLANRLEPVMFETFRGQFFFDQQAEALRALDDCDAVVFVLDRSLTPSVYSEFYAAASRNFRHIWLFLRDRVDGVDTDLQEFIGRVRTRYPYVRYVDAEDLKAKLESRISETRKLGPT